MKYLLSAFIVITFFACQKEPDSSLLNPANCSLEKIYSFDDTGNPDDTATLVYTGDQVTSVNFSSVTVTLEYSNGRVSRRNILAPGTTIAVYYDLFTYNPDGTFNHIESYFGGLGAPYLYYSYDYTYSGGKIATILEKQDTSSTGYQPVVPVYLYTFTYTGNNITKLVEEDLVDNLSDTNTYVYDNKANYIAKIPGLLYHDALFLDLYTPQLVMALSENNVIDWIDPVGSTKITYTEENGNVKAVMIDGIKLKEYKYKCQ